jgi:hypothetical protein
MTMTIPTEAPQRLPLEKRLPIPARPPWPALAGLAAAVALGGAQGASVPRAGLDGSWITAINVAAMDGWRFGEDVLFTYGPWGFVERPLIVDAPQYTLGLLFVVAATAAMYVAGYACLRRTWRPAVAAPVAFALTLCTPLSDPGLRFLCASLVFAALAIERQAAPATRPAGWRDAWPTAALAGFAGLMTQVKFSEGVAILALAGIVAITVRSWRALAWQAGAGVGAFVVVLLLGWLAAGQPLGNLGPWLRDSWRVASGYQEAMTREQPDNVLGYVLAAVLALVAIVVGVRAARHRGVAAAGSMLLVVVLLEFGFKHGFTRHDVGHEATFFVITGFLLLALASHARRPVAVLLTGALAFTLVPRDIQQFDPFAARDRWRTSVEALLNDQYRADLLASAKRGTRAQYQVPDSMVAATVGHPVSVDPWEATLPWTYSMDWHPVPVFQAYSAYTPELDELNADAIVAAPADQIVLREDREAFDGRNARWETPRYLLALACNYTPGASAGRWSTLHHGTDRCAAPSTVEIREVAAGEVVSTPAVGEGEILVARFTPEPDGLLTALGNAVLKDWTPLTATTEQGRFRAPEALATGPLMVSFPAELGWAAPFDGFQYKRLGFNRPGTLRFQVVRVTV